MIVTEWRTDIKEIPEATYFDVVVIDASGEQYRKTDCMLNSRQICEYDSSWGWEPIEYDYGNGDFRRVTHWTPIELPPVEDKGRPG